MQSQLEAESSKARSDDNHGNSGGFTTVEQLLQAGEASKWSPSASPRKEDDVQGDHHPQKKTLFSKMKEKARKLQHSLSNKKRNDENGIETSSPHGVRLDDPEIKEHKELEEEEEDPEYLGAPMYESEKAPEELKESARQHPRADPVISENHILPSPANHGDDLDHKNPNGSDRLMAETGHEPLAPTDVKEETLCSPSKSVREAVAEKLGPAYARVSDVSHAITSKLQALGLQETQRDDVSATDKNIVAASDNVVDSNKMGEKGGSMKDYIMQKLEPSEDDKALSRVISEAVSPRGAPITTNTHQFTEETDSGKRLQPN